LETTGAGLESFGDVEVGGTADKPVKLTGNVRSYGKFKVRSGGRVELDGFSADEQDFGGDGIEVEDGAELKVKPGKLSLSGQLVSRGKINVESGAEVTVTTPGATSTFGGDGLSVATGGSIKVDAGELAMDAPLVSDGLVTVAAGATLSMKKMANRVGGGGLKLEKGSNCKLAQGAEVEVEEVLDSDGAMELGGRMRLTKAGGANAMRGDSAIVLTADGKLELEGGSTLDLSAPMASAGHVKVGPGSTLAFKQTNGDVTLGGEGLELVAGSAATFDGATVGVSKLDADGAVTLSGTSTLQFVGSLDKTEASSIRGPLTVGEDAKLEFALGIATLEQASSSGKVTVGEYGELVVAGVAGDTVEFGGNGLELAGSLFVGEDATDSSGRRRLQARRAGSVRVSGKTGIKSQGTGAVRLQGGSTMTLATDPEAESDFGGLGAQIDASSTLILEAGSRARFSAPLSAAGQMRAGATVTVTVAADSQLSDVSVLHGGKLKLESGATRVGRVAMSGTGAMEVGPSAEATFEADAGGAERVLAGGGVTSDGALTVEGKLRAEGSSFRSGGQLKLKPGAELKLAQGPSQESALNGATSVEAGGSLTTVAGSRADVTGALESEGVLELAGRVSNGGRIFTRKAGLTKLKHIALATGSTTAVSDDGVLELEDGTVADGAITLGGRGQLKLKTGSHSIAGAGIVSNSVGTTVEVEGDVVMTAPLRTTGPTKLKAGGKLRLRPPAGDVAALAAVSVDAGAGLELGTGVLVVSGVLASDGKVDVTGGKLTSAGGRFAGGLAVAAGAELQLASGDTAVVGPLAADGEVGLSAGAELRVGSGSAVFKKLTSAGTVRLEADDGVDAASGRRRLEVRSGHTTIGGGGLTSTGHVVVPAGASLTFTEGGTSSLGGDGLASAGAVVVSAGTVTVTSGGLQSDGSVEVGSAGALVLDAPQNSLIAGTGLTVAVGGAVTVRQATIDFRSPMAGSGALVAEGAGAVSFAAGSGSSCPAGLGAACQDSVEATAVDCIGAWGTWGDCSATCDGGEQTRVYHIAVRARESGTECTVAEGIKDTQTCATACPVDCVGAWGTAGACAATCGTGAAPRIFAVTRPAANGGQACEAADLEAGTVPCEAAEACDPCDGADCGSGYCSAAEGEATCNCAAGFSGANCSQDACSTVDCGADGVCYGSGLCQCYSGYSGDTCSVAASDPCDAVDCGTNGYCSFSDASGSDASCTCAAGYTGDRCEGGPCDGVTCSGHGVCSGADAVCACSSGWAGDVCDIDVDGCSAAPCVSSRAVCTGAQAPGAGYTCGCATGYSGVPGSDGSGCAADHAVGDTPAADRPRATGGAALGAPSLKLAVACAVLLATLVGVH
jgi:hypothetical protein